MHARVHALRREARAVTHFTTEQHISAQEWICNGCGGHDRKSCSCAGATATSRAIQRLAAKHEQDRQRSKAYRERKTASRDAPVENIEENQRVPLNAVGKPYSPQYDPGYKPKKSPPSITRLYVSQKNIPMVGDEGLEDDLTPAQPLTKSLTKPLMHAGTPITARGLVRVLADATPEVRAEAAKALISGACQTDFAAVREAVGDLYQQLSKAGR